MESIITALHVALWSQVGALARIVLKMLLGATLNKELFLASGLSRRPLPVA